MIPSNGLVNTPYGLKNVLSLSVDDLVLTHKRRYKKIKDIQWEICELYDINLKCRLQNIPVAEKTKLLTLDGLSTVSELNKFRIHSICLAQEISAIDFPDEISDLYGGEDGQTFCPIDKVINKNIFDTVYNLITEDNSFCVDGIAIFNK